MVNHKNHEYIKIHLKSIILNTVKCHQWIVFFVINIISLTVIVNNYFYRLCDLCLKKNTHL